MKSTVTKIVDDLTKPLGLDQMIIFNLNLIRIQMTESFKALALKVTNQLPASEVIDKMVLEVIGKDFSKESVDQVLALVSNGQITDETAELLHAKLKASGNVSDEALDLIKRVEDVVRTGKLVDVVSNMERQKVLQSLLNQRKYAADSSSYIAKAGDSNKYFDLGSDGWSVASKILVH